MKDELNSNFEYSGNRELLNSENYLASYNDFIVSQIANLIPANVENYQILDFGAGIGTLATLLSERTNAIISCYEIDKDQASICEKRGFNTYKNLAELQDCKFDLIYSSNVLEHIEDDFKAIATIKNLLNINGKVFTYVPALQLLWTDMDEKVGHFRRYNKKHLIEIFEKNNLRVNSVRYVDCLGVLAMLIVKIIGFNSQAGLGNSKSLLIYDKAVWPISKFLDYIFNRIIGKNLLAVCSFK